MNHTIQFNRQFVPQLTTCINSSRMSPQEDFSLCQPFTPLCYPHPVRFSNHQLEFYTPPEFHTNAQYFQPCFLPSPPSYLPPNATQPPQHQYLNEKNLYTPSIRNVSTALPDNHPDGFRREFVDKKLVIKNNDHVLDNAKLEPISTNGPVMEATYYSHRIFVGSLARETTPVDLAMFFRRFGMVIETKVVNDAEGYSRGYGFVTFSSSEPVKTVLGLGSIYMGKKRIAVASAVRKKHPDELDN